jgi:hypothetical protein
MAPSEEMPYAIVDVIVDRLIHLSPRAVAEVCGPPPAAQRQCQKFCVSGISPFANFSYRTGRGCAASRRSPHNSMKWFKAVRQFGDGFHF